MTNTTIRRGFFYRYWKKILIFLSVFGPATITAMSDNDAGGVATYSIAGAKLGYPILFLLVIITVLLGVTQEMGMRLAIISRKGLADLIREKFGVRTAMFMFGALLIANLGTLITDLSAVKTTSRMLHMPVIPSVVIILFVSFLFIVKGNYKLTQTIMLLASLFYIAYIVSAIKAKPDWSLAVSNLFYPHGVQVTPTYMRDYLLIGMGV
ncbi:MAG: divalent metal cation transporter, partial [Chloroflexi bacterium]|nr:divalent metal cation transporter [Chloroflexota bacterium]